MPHQPMEAECNERSPIATCLETILRTADLHVEHEKAAGVALAPYRDGHDVADALIGEITCSPAWTKHAPSTKELLNAVPSSP